MAYVRKPMHTSKRGGYLKIGGDWILLEVGMSAEGIQENGAQCLERQILHKNHMIEH